MEEGLPEVWKIFLGFWLDWVSPMIGSEREIGPEREFRH